MNKIKKFVLYSQRIRWLSFNKSKYQCTIQKREFSTRKFSLIYCFSPSLKTIRHISNDSKNGLYNLIDTNDILLTSIKNVKQTTDLLQIIRLHNSVMTVQHNLEVLNTLFLLQKSKRTNMSKEELVRSPEFTLLCHKLQNHSRNLDLNNILNSIKCLLYLGVSVKSNIIQMFLQLLSKMINDMSLQQIIFLHFLLKNELTCPLADALKIALPIVFETQIQNKLDNNIYQQVECLSYITKQKLSQEVFDFVMSKIIKNIDELNTTIFKRLLLLLYFKDYSTEKYIYIINKYLQLYMNRTDFVGDILYIEAVLSRMLNKYFTDSKLFYNEYFLNSVVEYLIKNQENFENIGYIIKKLNKIGYVHYGLLDYMTNLLVIDSELLQKTKFGVLLSYIAACANGNYIPAGFVQLKSQILNRFYVQKDILQLPWLTVTFDLAVLGIWSDELLEKVFSRNFLYEFLKRDANVRDYIMLLKLYQATVTLYPGGYKQSLPPMKFIEKAIDIYQQNINDFPLKSALEHGLGGSDYILTGVKSKLGHFIDHVVVFRPGGFSVAINQENNKPILLENIKSDNNLLICILLYRPNNYVINLNTLKGPFVLMNKTIEALGVKLLPISMDVWDSLMDYEKIPYIMRELKSIANVNLVSEINV